MSTCSPSRAARPITSQAAESAEVSLSVSGESAVVNGIPQLLDAIVHNLCENAIKYNRPGGFVKVNVRREGGSALLTVEDNGIGIPPEQQERIFERFYRVDKSHSRRSAAPASDFRS